MIFEYMFTSDITFQILTLIRVKYPSSPQTAPGRALQLSSVSDCHRC